MDEMMPVIIPFVVAAFFVFFITMMVFLSKNVKKCRWCLSVMPKDASVCAACKRDQ